MRQGNNNYIYDTMNRIDTMSFTFDGQTALFDYAYDLVGRQTQSALMLNNVSDRIIDNQYDYMGRAVAVRLHGTANSAIDDIMVEFDYNAVGALTNVNRYEWDDNDDLYELIAKSNIQYNAKNQITNITHADASNVAIVTHSYSFSPDGNITQYINSIDGTVTYTNDFLGQLTGADYSNLDITDESYQYDLNGNRELVTNANGDLVVYSTGTNNELTSDGAYSYAYDAEGNRISKTNAAGTERELYEWDYRNRLSSVTKQEYNATTQEWQTVQIVEYAYDYNNVLIRKVLDADGDGVSDSKTIFLPENYQTAIQLDDADLSDSTYETVSHRYLWTPQNQDKLLADVTPTETLWTLTDHLGTIRDIIQNTPSGLLVPAHVIYDAYGNVLSCKDPNGTDVSSPVLFGFTGKYFDSDTQLQNNVNRWYNAATGRWLSIDPISFNGNDTNLYCYVGNSSTRYRDSFGLANEDKRNCHEITKTIFTHKTNGNKNAIDGVIPLYGILSLRYQLAVSGSILVTTQSCEALCGCTWKTGYSEIKASANLDITLKATLGVNFSKKPFVGGFYSLSVGLFAEGNFKREHSFLHVTNPCGNPHEGKYCSELNASLRIGGEALLQYETGRFFSWTIGAQLYGEVPFITRICFTIDKNGNLKLDGIGTPTFKDAHLKLRAYFGYEYVVTLL